MDKDTLYRFFEGIASVQDQEAIKTWLEASSDHQHELLKERKMYDAMLLLGEKESFASESRKKPMYKHSSLRTELLKIAAVVILTLGLNYIYQRYTVEPVEEIAMQTITVPAGQRVNIMLPDGSNVWLNARTTIQYPFVFKGNKREVKLDGEAYFDVTKDPEKPFVVETDKANVQVYGTHFNVEAYSSKEEFETTLMSGSVKVESKMLQGDALMLRPNEKAYFDDGKLKVVEVDDFNQYRWKEGLICFKDETFRTIMDDFEKYYGISIHIDNQRVLKYFYTGKFRQSDGIDYALRVLQKDIRFHYTRDDENHIIYIK